MAGSCLTVGYYLNILLLLAPVLHCAVDKTVLLTSNKNHRYPGRVLYYRPEILHIRGVPWEQPLKQTTYLTLNQDSNQPWPGKLEAKRQNATDKKLNEIYTAQYVGLGDEAPKFGDIVIMARGKLLQIKDGGYRFVQDPYSNDCEECHTKSTFFTDHRGDLENVVALWTVKRIRHRDSSRGHRYELKFTISPTNEKVNYNLDYALPGKSFILKDEEFPEYFTSGTSQTHTVPNPRQAHAHDRIGKARGIENDRNDSRQEQPYEFESIQNAHANVNRNIYESGDYNANSYKNAYATTNGNNLHKNVDADKNIYVNSEFTSYLPQTFHRNRPIVENLQQGNVQFNKKTYENTDGYGNSHKKNRNADEKADREVMTDGSRPVYDPYWINKKVAIGTGGLDMYNGHRHGAYGIHGGRRYHQRPELNTNEYYTQKNTEPSGPFYPGILIQTNPNGFNPAFVHDLRPGSKFNRVKFPPPSEDATRVTSGVQNGSGLKQSAPEMNHQIPESTPSIVTHLHHHYYIPKTNILDGESYIEVYNKDNTTPVSGTSEDVGENQLTDGTFTAPSYPDFPTSPDYAGEIFKSDHPHIQTITNPANSYYGVTTSDIQQHEHNIRGLHKYTPPHPTQATYFSASPRLFNTKYSEPDPLYHTSSTPYKRRRPETHEGVTQVSYFIPEFYDLTNQRPQTFASVSSQIDSGVTENIVYTKSNAKYVVPTTGGEGYGVTSTQPMESTKNTDGFSNSATTTQYPTNSNSPDSINAQLPAPEQGSELYIPYVSANVTAQATRQKSQRNRYLRPRNSTKARWTPRKPQTRTRIESGIKSDSTTTATSIQTEGPKATNSITETASVYSVHLSNTTTDAGNAEADNTSTTKTLTEVSTTAASNHTTNFINETLVDNSTLHTQGIEEPITSKSYITSISFQVGNKNRTNKHESTTAAAELNINDITFKANVHEVDNKSDFHVYRADSDDIILDDNSLSTRKSARKAPKIFDKFALSIINHARREELLNNQSRYDD